VLRNLLARRALARAWAHAREGEPAHRERHYRRCIELSTPSQPGDQRSIEARIAVADLCSADGRQAEALAVADPLVSHYEDAVGLDRLLLARALVRLGDLYKLTGRLDDALVAFTRAVKVTDSLLVESALERPEIEKLLAADSARAAGSLKEARERLIRNPPRPFSDLLAAPARYEFALGVIEIAETSAEALISLGELFWQKKGFKPAAFNIFARMMQILDFPLQIDAPILLRNVFTFVDKASTPSSLVAARPLALHGLAIADRKWGPISDQVLPALERALEIEYQTGNRKGAAHLVDRCREITRAAWSRTEPEVRRRLCDVAACLYRVDELDLAAEIAVSGLRLALEEDAAEDPSIRDWLKAALLVLTASDQPARAEAVGVETIARCERTWGRDDPRLAPLLRLLADARYEAGNFAAAEPLAERILALSGASSDESLRASNHFFRGAVRYKLGRVREAEKDWETSLQLTENLQPPDPQAVANSMIHLASCFRIDGKFTRAASLLETALEIENSRNDPMESAAILRELGELWVAQNDLTQAEIFYAKALALWQDNLEGSDPALALLLSRQAALLSLLDRPTEAQETFKRVIEMSKFHLGETHPQVAECLLLAVDASRRTGDAATAELLASRALAIYDERLGPTAPHTVACRSLLNDLRAAG
jgi:tetratricopeptide (TPR) repeat protein